MNDLQQRLANLSPTQRALLERKLAEIEKPLPPTLSVQSRIRNGRPTPLSFAQQRLWFLDQLLAGNPVYNMPTAFRLSGFLDIGCLEQSLNAVIERHEVLRTTIESVEGKPVQIVRRKHRSSFGSHDLSIGPEEEREAEASKILAQEARRPFNLAQDLMLRATLIKRSEQEHILLLVMHHIASDGWSMGILMRELSHFYEAEITGRPSSLPELPIQYADYAEWQLEWLQGKVLDEQLDYWKQQLAGAPTRLESSDRPGATGGSNVPGRKSATGIIPRTYPRSKSVELAREGLTVHNLAGGFPGVVVSLHRTRGYSRRVADRRTQSRRS